VLNRKIFIIPKILKTGSAEISAEGVMTRMDPQIPRVQVRDISDDDLRLHIFNTSGILKSGIIMLAAIPRVVIIPVNSIYALLLTGYIFMRMCQFELF
jgi:hypothetical protein